MSLGGSLVRGRQRLGDITNVKQEDLVRKSMAHQEKPNLVVVGPPVKPKEYSKLLMENTTLLRLLGERNQILEYSNLEMQKLRVALQKLQQQNWQLAQANSQMLAELNMGKDRLKVLQHELTCTQAALKEKDLKQEKTDEVENIPADIISKNEEQTMKSDGVTRVESHLETCIPSRKRRSGNQSLVTTSLQLAGKDGKKRRSTRKQCSDLKHQTCEPACLSNTIDSTNEDQNRNLVVSTANSNGNIVPNEGKEQDGNGKTPISNAEKEEKPGKRKVPPLFQSQEPPRSSIGRPSRRTTIGVSYKEIPLNTKMRRDS